MLPIPSRVAIIAFVGACWTLAVGLAADSALVVALGNTTLFILAMAAVISVPLGRRVRRERLEFAWWLDRTDSPQGTTVVPGSPFEVRCYVRHRGTSPLRLIDIQPLVPAGTTLLENDTDAFSEVRIEPSGRTEFTFRLEHAGVGRVVVHGLAVNVRGPLGLFAVPLYFPNPLVVRVLPRVTMLARRGRPRSGQPMSRQGRAQLRRRGGGTDFHELRELQPGDPFKSIAWKASARAGRLLIKEVEQEVQEQHAIVLDVTGTMRGGPLGSRKLDYAFDAVAGAAQRAIHDGDRVAFITADRRPLAHVVMGEGATQMSRVYDAMVAATEVVDQDLTDVDLRDVALRVANYVRRQDGVDYGATRDTVDVPALTKHVERALDHSTRETLGAAVHASSPRDVILRTFCKARGLQLPYRPHPGDGRKGPGLAKALQLATARGGPRSVVLVTDFDGVHNTEELARVIRLARAHRHALRAVVIADAGFAPEPRTEREAMLHAVFQRTEARHVREARAFFSQLGVPLTVRGPSTPAFAALTSTTAKALRRVRSAS